MAKEFESIDVWVGRFADEDRHAAYFEEKYDDEDEDAPLNEFCEDMGQSFCDHDFMGGAFADSTGDDIHAILQECPWSVSYAEGVAESFEARREQIGEFNAILLVFGESVESPRDAARPGVDLFYLGRFPCDPGEAESADGDDGIPDRIYLQLLDGVTLTVNNRRTSVIPVDARGLTLGCHGAADTGPYLDLSERIQGPPLGKAQVKIYCDQYEQWVIEDLGGNQQTRVGGGELNLARSFPWDGKTLSVGNLNFRWCCSLPDETD